VYIEGVRKTKRPDLKRPGDETMTNANLTATMTTGTCVRDCDRERNFNPINFGFTWTEGWYSWDQKAAHAAARRDRDGMMRSLRQIGRTVKATSQAGCLMSRGGIGSGHPYIEEIVTVYGYIVTG
jgi:hypothetical protein